MGLRLWGLVTLFYMKLLPPVPSRAPQIVSVTVCEGGKCLKVAFRPNKPSRKKMEEDTLTVVKVGG